MKNYLIILFAILCNQIHAQQVGLDAFIRLPHIVEYQIKQNALRYTPAIATGLTVSCRKAFVDFGVFLDQQNTKGYFSYGAISLYAKQAAGGWIVLVNGFGELTYLPNQPEQPAVFIKTLGVSPVLVKTSPFGIFAMAITLGPAFANDAVSLNSRLILNYALPIIKKNK